VAARITINTHLEAAKSYSPHPMQAHWLEPATTQHIAVVLHKPAADLKANLVVATHTCICSSQPHLHHQLSNIGS